MARRRALTARLGRDARQHHRKLHPQDCGVPRCGTCHPEKGPPRTPTRAERLAALRRAEACDDLGLRVRPGA